MAESKIKILRPSTWFQATVDKDTGAWRFMDLIGRFTKSGNRVTEDGALKVPVFWSCVRVLATSASSLPLKAYKEQDGIRKVDTGTDHRVRRSKRPNQYLSMPDFIEFAIVNMCVSGNAFAMIARNGQGEPTQLIPVAWSNVKINIDDAGVLTYEVTLPNGEITLVSYENMMHFKILSRDGIVGMNPVTYLAETLGLAIGARDWASAFMRTGGWSGGYIIYKEFLNKEQQSQIKSQIPDIRRGGVEDMGKMGMLQGGPSIVSTGMSPKDSQFLEVRQFSDEEISGAMGVPLWLINRMRSGSYVGNGLEQQIISFLMFGLNPYLKAFETEWNFKIYGSDQTSFVEFTRQAMMQMDSKARSDYYKAALGGSGSSGYMYINEVREKENLPPLEGEEYNRVTVWQFGNEENESNSSDDGGDGETKQVENIQQEALNGAQVTALQGIVFAFASGQLPKETAKALISVAFPLITESQIDTMLSSEINVEGDQDGN